MSEEKERRKREFTPEEREIFVEAFSTHTSGLSRICHCGKVYYDSYNDYDWEEDEYESFQDDEEAVALPHSVGTLQFEGREYVMDCECWTDRGAQIFGFLISHARPVANMINDNKLRALKDAWAMPVVGDGHRAFTTMADSIIRRSVGVGRGSKVIALKDIHLNGYGDSRDLLLCRAGDPLEIREVRMDPDLYTVSPPGVESGEEFIMHRQEFEAAAIPKEKKS